MTEENKKTPLTEIARLRADAIRPVADANRMPASNRRPAAAAAPARRSDERREGHKCRSRWSPYH